MANSGKNFNTSDTVIIPFASSNIKAVFDASRWIMYSAILSQRYLSCEGEVELSVVAALVGIMKIKQKIRRLIRRLITQVFGLLRWLSVVESVRRLISIKNVLGQNI